MIRVIREPVIEQLIVEHSDHAGIARRDNSAQEILDRCLYAMINEGAKSLEEGMAARPVDIDMVWPHGYGIPAWRSEPLFYADQVGLPTVCEAILRYRDRFGDDFWSTAPLVEELARSGNGFFPSSVTAPTIVC